MNWFFFSFLAAIFILSPYYKGLYFNTSLYGISVIISILCLILLIYLTLKKELYLLKKALPLLLLPLCYAFPLFIAESPKGAIDSFLQWITYAAFFILLYWVARVKSIANLLPVIFQITGAWLAFFTLLAFYGAVHFRGAFVAGRFGSVFQYANTFGMLMGVFSLFSIIMLTKKDLSKWELFLYSFPLIPFIICFIQSSSRGMFLVFPLVWLMGLVFLNFKRQLEFIVYTLVPFGLSLLIYKFMESSNDNPGLATLTVSIVIFVLFVWFIKYSMNRYTKSILLEKIEVKRASKIIIPFAIVIVGMLGILDIKNEGIIFHKLPNQLQSRLSSTNIGAATAQERLIFLKDGLKMSSDSPIIGFGGKAWAAIYKKYQHMPYISNKAHNGYLEWLIDTGWIGFILFIGVIAYFFWLLIRNYKSQKENTLQLAVVVSALGIFLHSFLDYNFSYSTIWLIVIWLFVMGIEKTNDSTSVQDKKVITFQAVPLIVFSIMLVLNLFFSYRFMVADMLYTNFRQSKSLLFREQTIKRAVSYDSKNIVYQRNLADTYLFKFRYGHVPKAKQQLEDSIHILTRLEPNNSDLLLKAGNLSENVMEKEDALKYYSTGLKIDHYNRVLYENSIRLKVTLALEGRKNEKKESVEKLLQSAINDYHNEKKWYDYFLTHAPKEAERFNSRNFAITDRTHYFAALGYFLQNDFSKLQSIFDSIKKNNEEKEKICALEIIALQTEGNLDESQALLADYEKPFPKLQETVKNMQQLLTVGMNTE